MNADPHAERLVFVNRCYWPEEQATAQLLADLAEGLAARGRRVTVVAAAPGRRADETPCPRRNGVDIVRVRSAGHAHGMLAKGAAYLAFALGARRELRKRLRTGDRLVVMTDPPLLATVGAAAARRAEARLFHWIQDVHPEIGIALSGSRLLAGVFAPWMRRRDRAWLRATACVPVGGDMAGLVARHGVPPERIRVIPNWAPGGQSLAPVPPERNPFTTAWGLRGRVAVVYSGNLGRVHALELVLEAAARLRDLPGVVFLFIGDGPQRRSLESRAMARGLGNVRFLPAQPRQELAASLSAADVHLVTLRDGCERLVFPSKLYGIAAVGRPVVYVGPKRAEIANIISAGRFGAVVDPSDPAALAGVLRQLAGEPDRRAALGAAALAWYRTTGGLSAAVAAWDTLLA